MPEPDRIRGDRVASQHPDTVLCVWLVLNNRDASTICRREWFRAACFRLFLYASPPHTPIPAHTIRRYLWDYHYWSYSSSRSDCPWMRSPYPSARGCPPKSCGCAIISSSDCGSAASRHSCRRSVICSAPLLNSTSPPWITGLPLCCSPSSVPA